MIAPAGPTEGEVVLWSGAPDPMQHFTPADWFIVPFSVVWTSVVVAVLLNVDSPGFFGPIVGSFMILAGAYLVVGRFLVKAAVKRKTRYAITSRRAIIYGPRRTFEFDLMARHPHVERQRTRGRSTFVFTSVGPRTNGKFTLILIENSGLDVHLIPGLHTRFKFVDVLEDAALRSAIAQSPLKLTG